MAHVAGAFVKLHSHVSPPSAHGTTPLFLDTAETSVRREGQAKEPAPGRHDSEERNPLGYDVVRVPTGREGVWVARTVW